MVLAVRVSRLTGRPTVCHERSHRADRAVLSCGSLGLGERRGWRGKIWLEEWGREQGEGGVQSRPGRMDRFSNGEETFRKQKQCGKSMIQKQGPEVSRVDFQRCKN